MNILGNNNQTGRNISSLQDAEHYANYLIHEIWMVSQELKILNNNLMLYTNTNLNPSLEIRINSFQQKLVTLCGELEAIKETFMQAMMAMENNASRLENRDLNTPEAEMHLKTASDIAINEVDRIRQIVHEIEATLLRADATLTGIGVQFGEFPYLVNNNRPISVRQQPPSLDNILAAFDEARGVPSLMDVKAFPSPIINQETPLLGSAPSPGLKSALDKIPSPSSSSFELHAAPYADGLYKNDTYSGQVKLSPDPYDLKAGPIDIGTQYRPAIAQAGFNGSYVV